MFNNYLPIKDLPAFNTLALESCVLHLVSCLLYKCRELSITIEESLQIDPFFAKQTQIPKKSNKRK